VGEYLKNDARLVFSPIRCGGAESFGSVIEMSYIDFFLSGSVITAWKLLRKRVIVGKSLLIHRKTLDQFGGFAYFADVLAEDYWLGETLAQSGFPVRCNYTWVENIKKTSSVKTYFDRMNRWAKLRFNLNKPLYLSEILLNPFALTLLFVPFLKTAALPFVAVVIVLKTILEYLIFFAVNSGTRPKLSVILSLGPAALVKDMSLLITYALPIFSHTVQWRGGKVHIGKNTVIALNENLLYDGA
jgi:ceramide glucosyltransferase